MTRFWCPKCSHWLQPWQIDDTGHHMRSQAWAVDGARIEIRQVRCGPVAEDVRVSQAYL